MSEIIRVVKKKPKQKLSKGFAPIMKPKLALSEDSNIDLKDLNFTDSKVKQDDTRRARLTALRNQTLDLPVADPMMSIKREKSLDRVTKMREKAEKSMLKNGYASPFLEDYSGMFKLPAGLYPEISPTELGCILANWARNNEDALSISQFRSINFIKRATYIIWQERYPVFQEAHQFALDCIAARRESGVLNGKFNSNFILALHPLYDRDYKEYLQWKEEMKRERESEDKRNITIVMDGITLKPTEHS